jgi:hypothetical protein
MKELFYVAGIKDDGSELFGESFIDDLPDGTYQIQKVFVKKS